MERLKDGGLNGRIDVWTTSDLVELCGPDLNATRLIPRARVSNEKGREEGRWGRMQTEGTSKLVGKRDRDFVTFTFLSTRLP